MTSPLKIAVAGANGRMGRAIQSLLGADPGFAFVGGIGRPGSVGAGLIDRAAAIGVADVILDFTTGSAAAELAGLCAAAGGPAVIIGATGFEPDELERIGEAARRIPILRSGNFSIGLNMLVGLVEQAARALPAAGWDIEILEAHHAGK
ncbi:dihydrodipicolinate reductase, partial [Rhizobium sp. Pop5]